MYTNPLVIQLVHRTLAYLIGLGTVLWFYLVWKRMRRGWLYQLSKVPLVLVLLQITLGILALVNSINGGRIGFSVAHQFVGMLLLVSFLVVGYLCGKRGVRG